MSIPTRQKIMADQSYGMEWIVALWFRTQDVEMVLHAHDSIETIAICSEALSSLASLEIPLKVCFFYNRQTGLFIK
jgi:hypothetical protein